MSKKYIAICDLGIDLNNITSVSHGNQPCQAVSCLETDL